MARIAFLAFALLPMLGIAPPANAQERIYPWCLQDTRAATVTCAYRSQSHCLASRNSTNDTCIPNPDWQDRRRY